MNNLILSFEFSWFLELNKSFAPERLPSRQTPLKQGYASVMTDSIATTLSSSGASVSQCISLIQEPPSIAKGWRTCCLENSFEGLIHWILRVPFQGIHLYLSRGMTFLCVSQIMSCTPYIADGI